MQHPPHFRATADRRDVDTRPANAPCPQCASSKVSSMTRTQHLVYFGCDACLHVWSAPKPGHEHIARPATVFTRAE
jgi:rubredoxin